MSIISYCFDIIDLDKEVNQLKKKLKELNTSLEEWRVCLQILPHRMEDVDETFTILSLRTHKPRIHKLASSWREVRFHVILDQETFCYLG